MKKRQVLPTFPEENLGLMTFFVAIAVGVVVFSGERIG